VNDVKLGTHYTLLNSTGRVHGPWTQVSFMIPVFTGRAHDIWRLY